MNQNPNTLALALVHQAVQASELQEAQQAVAAQAERIKELQGAVDSLAKERQEIKAAHEEHLKTVAGQLQAEQDALRDAHIEHNKTLRALAERFGFLSEKEMLATIVPAPEPAVVESEGGEAA